MENQGDEIDYGEDLDQIDFENYKGIFYEEPAEKYQDEVTGAHFEYFDMCRRLKRLQKELEAVRTDENLPNDSFAHKPSNKKIVKLLENGEAKKETKESGSCLSECRAAERERERASGNCPAGLRHHRQRPRWECAASECCEVAKNERKCKTPD